MDREKPSSLLASVQRLVDAHIPASLFPSKLNATPKMHKDATTSAAIEIMAPSSGDNKPSPFLVLPLELRETIYICVQGGPQIKLTPPPDWKPCSPFAGNVLLHLNKQIFAEYSKLILSTGSIALDFLSHDPTPREAEILRTAHKLSIHCMTPSVCGKKGYNHEGGKPKLPKQPGKDLKAWVDELRRNETILRLEVVITQCIVISCQKHDEGEECSHVRMFRAATRQFREVGVGGDVRIVWEPRGWGLRRECAEMSRVWSRDLEGRMGGKRGREVDEAEIEVVDDEERELWDD